MYLHLVMMNKTNDVEEEEFESLLSAYSSDDSDGLDVEI